MGKKMIIKVNESIDLDLDVLGFIDPRITVNIIQDGKRVKKIHPSLPERVTDVIKCKNPRCITSVEQELPHIFKLTDPEKAYLPLHLLASLRQRSRKTAVPFEKTAALCYNKGINTEKKRV